MKYLISPNKKQYKANLHAHTVLSDGKKTPEELKEMYKNEGYSVLSITDHERPVSHQKLSDDDFIMITGYEAYIRSNKEGRYDIYESEVHLNLLSRDPENVKLIGYDEKYLRYLKRDDALNTVEAAEPICDRRLDTEYVNEFIKSANKNGYIVNYNHPYWSMLEEAKIFEIEGLCSLEISNASSYMMNNLEYCGALYDRMLSRGIRAFCHGSDDNHNANPLYSDSFGSFTMIMPESFEYGAIVDAVEKGAMYSSMGPTFTEVSIEGNKVHIECSPVKHIAAFTGSKTPKRKHAPIDGFITSADFELDDRAKFLRVSITDECGKHADTRGFFRDELPF